MHQKISFIFFGSSHYSLPVIQTLFEKTYLKGIVTRLDKPVGRKKILTASVPKQFALDKNIPVFTPKDKDELSSIANDLQQLNSDFFLVADYGMIISEQILNIPRYGSFNIHFSLLPQLRGASPVQYAILHGLTKSGISIVKMTPHLDDGDIFYQEEFTLTGNETTGELYPKLFDKISPVIAHLFEGIKQNKVASIPQDHSKATYSKKINKLDGYLPWNLITLAMKAKYDSNEMNEELSIFRHFREISITNFQIPDSIYYASRAFAPWPGIWTIVKTKNQEKRLKILKTHMEEKKLILDTVQFEGKNPINYKQIQNTILL